MYNVFPILPSPLRQRTEEQQQPSTSKELSSTKDSTPTSTSATSEPEQLIPEGPNRETVVLGWWRDDHPRLTLSNLPMGKLKPLLQV